VGVSRDCPNFLPTPYYPRNGKSYGFQIWPVHLEGPSEQKPIKKFREKGAWAYPGTAQFFRIPPIISGTGKATDFKFCTYIYRLNRNKSPLKILRKVTKKFSGHPYVGRIVRSSLRQLSFLVITVSLLHSRWSAEAAEMKSITLLKPGTAPSCDIWMFNCATLEQNDAKICLLQYVP